MTDKSLHPGLGSGALREALAKLKAELDHLAGAEYIIDRTVAALSLSSPIEAPAKCDVCAAPKEVSGDGEHVCDLTASQAYSLGWRRGNNAQASSEIREAAITGYELAGCADRSGVVVYLDGRVGNSRLMVAGDWDRFAEEVRRALAPSRQGAAKKVEG